MTALITTAPKMDVALEDMEHLVEELRISHAIYGPLLQRREQRAAAYTDLQGWLAPLPRKSIEPMVLAVEGVVPKAVRAIQSCSSAGMWDDERLLHQHWKEVATDRGAADRVLLGDGRDVPQPGLHAAGVTRQDGGELGKRAHCQAGVLVGSVSTQGYPVLDRRRYVPAEWRTDDASAARRTPCGIPPDLTFKTKPEWGQERLAAVVQAQRLRCRWVVADEACGGNPSVVAGVAGLGRWYVAEVPQTTRVWGERPATHVPSWRGRGRRPQPERLVDGAPAAYPVLEVAAALPAAAWTRQTITEGSQGPMVAECAALRVIAGRDTRPGPEVWLVLRRHTATGEWKTYRCN